MSTFDINEFKPKADGINRYERHIAQLAASNLQTSCIESTVEKSMENIQVKGNRSFVIYGEPQSGKTEMMIGLTAKLLDAGFTMIVHLLNDNVELLEQNLDRFKRSGLAPAARSFHDVLDPEIDLTSSQWVIFCKKNGSDLRKFHNKLGNMDGLVVIDDEADFATPNAKVNRQEQTAINQLIEQLLKQKGTYIGVTATPARLDLNNTFANDNELWVNFEPHKNYAGQDVFFPLEEDQREGNFILTPLPDTNDTPKYLREAFLRFCIHVAYLNHKRREAGKPENSYSFLIHTSGKTADHQTDRKVIDKLLGDFTDHDSKGFNSATKYLWDYAHEMFPEIAPALTHYVVDNISRCGIIVMNSKKFDANFRSATDPAALFTVVIGGNIISRGVTFNRMVGMFFTRDVKHKIQQDTYIQRARMFGNRGNELPLIELTIPNALYTDWHRCFVFHRLSLAAIKEQKGSPVWLADNRITPAASGSIDRTTVSMDKGEMGFGIFTYNDSLAGITSESVANSYTCMDTLAQQVGEDAFPEFLAKFIKSMCGRKHDLLAIHPPASIADQGEGTDQEKIERSKGFLGTNQLQKTKFPDAIHHLRIFYNSQGLARLYYKYEGNIQFAKNLKKIIEKNAQKELAA